MQIYRTTPYVNPVFRFLIPACLWSSVFCYYISIISGISIISLADDVLAILLAIFLIIFRINNSRENTSLLELIPIIFFLYLFITTLINDVPLTSFLIQSRSYILPMILVSLISQAKVTLIRADDLYKHFALISIIIIIGASYEILFETRLIHSLNRMGDELDLENNLRAASYIGNPIDMANFLVISLVIFLFYKFEFNLKQWRYLLIIILTFLGIFLSGSRSPILASLIAILLLAPWRSSKKRYIFLGFALILASAWVFVGDRILIINEDYFLNDIYRAAFLVDAFTIFLDHPWIGTGPGTYGGWVSINYNLSPIYSEYDIKLLGLSSIDMFWPHFIVEVGFIGIFLWLFFIYLLSKTLKVNATQMGYNFNKLFLALTSVLIVLGSFSISLETTLISYSLVIIVGTIINLGKCKPSSIDFFNEPNQ